LSPLVKDWGEDYCLKETDERGVGTLFLFICFPTTLRDLRASYMYMENKIKSGLMAICGGAIKNFAVTGRKKESGLVNKNS